MAGMDRTSRKLRYGFLLLLVCVALGATGRAQQLQKDTLHGMKWRLVGPFRGGRVEAVAGVAGTGVFYFGGVAGRPKRFQ